MVKTDSHTLYNLQLVLLVYFEINMKIVTQCLWEEYFSRKCRKNRKYKKDFSFACKSSLFPFNLCVCCWGSFEKGSDKTKVLRCCRIK